LQKFGAFADGFLKGCAPPEQVLLRDPKETRQRLSAHQPGAAPFPAARGLEVSMHVCEFE